MPTLEGDGRLYGVAVTRVEYPAGIGGVRLSLTEISRRIYEGSRAPSMRAFAEGVVANWARIPRNVQLKNREAAQILLDYVRAAVRYRPDPPLTEYTQSAAVTLCVPGAPMCIPVEDCDGLVVALATLAAAYGIPVHVVKQSFGGDQQEHVLVEVQDDNGQWLSADPSVQDRPLGWRAPAVREDIIDPSDPSSIGLVGAPEAEFIGIGRVGAFRGTLRQPRSLVQLVQTGLGAPLSAVLSPSLVWQMVADRKIWGGQRYRIGLIANFVSSGGSISPAVDRSKLENELGIQWTIELLAPTGDATGGIQSWIFQGVAKTDFQLTDSVMISYVAVSGQVPASVVSGGDSVATQSSSNVGAAKVAFVAAALGLVAYYGAPAVIRRVKRRRRAA